MFFWGVHNQGELDLLLMRGGRRHGFEIKFSDAPRVGSSQKLAVECLGLDRLDIVCPGNQAYPLAEKIHVTGLDAMGGLWGD